MVIIERHGSNKLENKLCRSPLDLAEGRGTPILSHASRKRGTTASVSITKDAKDANNLEIVLPPLPITSHTHTSTRVDDRLRSQLLSSWVHRLNTYDETLVTPSNAPRVTSSSSSSSQFPPSEPLTCRQEPGGHVVPTKPASTPEAIHSSFTFVNSSTSDTSKPTISSVQTASPSASSEASTHSSIYLDTDNGNFHWRKRKRKSVVPDITSSLYSYLFGYKKLRLLVLYLILIMCALLEGCKCSNMCVETTKVLPEFLQVDLNQSSVGLSQGQCLRVTNDFVEGICDLPKSDRIEAIRRINTKFCGLPLYSVLNNTEKEIVEQCGPRYGCSSTLKYVQDLDTKLSDVYCSFTDILDRMDCEDKYSYNGNCFSCREAYKQWLCSVHFDYYLGGLQIKPCLTVCDQVSRNCPFFRPYGDTHIGEPGFLCKDLTIHHNDAAAIYGQENCCFQPCQVFITDDWNQGCPQLNVTSNCTSAITTNRTTATLGLNLFLALFVLVSWIMRALSRYICIGLT